jgi:hypothetical protein
VTGNDVIQIIGTTVKQFSNYLTVLFVLILMVSNVTQCGGGGMDLEAFKKNRASYENKIYMNLLPLKKQAVIEAHLGLAYRDGPEEERDQQRAFCILNNLFASKEKKDALTSSDAAMVQFCLCSLYIDKKDIEKAFEFLSDLYKTEQHKLLKTKYQVSVKQGLWFMYFYGQGLEKRPYEALKIFRDLKQSGQIKHIEKRFAEVITARSIELLEGAKEDIDNPNSRLSVSGSKEV